jgi:hypothetical protein
MVPAPLNHELCHTTLKAFAKARPPGIKHPHFIEELYHRYAGGDGGADSDSGVSDAADSGVDNGMEQ